MYDFENRSADSSKTQPDDGQQAEEGGMEVNRLLIFVNVTRCLRLFLSIFRSTEKENKKYLILVQREEREIQSS